ncbi:MAG: hypothetical protein SFX73_00120 [Kofleriaceae bacterium]|nr:hypothetical protein [Kofleriaceae bacterium]
MMNTVRLLALPLSLVAAVAAPALADNEGPVTHTDQLIVVTPNPPVVISNGTPAAAPGAGPSTVAPIAEQPASAAPQTEDWSNVNHINGQIVKVGEKSDYLIAYKKTNIATNPIGFLFGFYGVSVSHALSNHVAVRLDANLFNIDGTTGYELGASLPIYFRRTYSGPFFEPGLITRGFRNNYDYAYDCYDCSGGSMDTMVGPEMLFGWHWTFDSGLNVAMAFGAARDISADNDEYDYDTDIEPAGYFRIGYAF